MVMREKLSSTHQQKRSPHTNGKKWFCQKEAPAVQHQRRTMTRDGIRVRLEANANSPEEVYDAVRRSRRNRTDAIRIFYMGRSSLPEPGEELNYYKRIHEAAGGRPVTIRLLDLGADKTLPYEGPTRDQPQLGLRGIRYLLPIRNFSVIT